MARSKSACVTFAGFGICAFFRSVCRLHMLSLRIGPAESSRGRAHASRLRSFGNCAKASPYPASFPPNKSFKPTPHRGINSVLYATLHAVAAPLWVGLTPALGGKKHSAVAFSALQHFGFGQHCSSDSSWARCFFGQVCCVRSHFACVTLASFGCTRLLSFRVAAPEPVTSDKSSGKVAMRAHACGLRFSAGSPGLHSRWLPSRLTSRSSRPHIVASTACFTLRCTLLPPRRGAA